MRQRISTGIIYPSGAMATGWQNIDGKSVLLNDITREILGWTRQGVCMDCESAAEPRNASGSAVSVWHDTGRLSGRQPGYLGTEVGRIYGLSVLGNID